MRTKTNELDREQIARIAAAENPSQAILDTVEETSRGEAELSSVRTYLEKRLCVNVKLEHLNVFDGRRCVVPLYMTVEDYLVLRSIQEGDTVGNLLLYPGVPCIIPGTEQDVTELPVLVSASRKEQIVEIEFDCTTENSLAETYGIPADSWSECFLVQIIL